MKRLLLFLLFSVFVTEIFTQTLLQNYPLPNNSFYNNAYGLVNKGSSLWISSGSSSLGKGVIHSVNYDGITNDSLIINYPSIKESQGLASDDVNFWYLERKTSKCDLYKVSPSGTVLDSIILSQVFGFSVYCGGAAYENNFLWISVYYPNAFAKLYKIDLAAKTVRDSISTFGLQPQGITIKGDTLFYVMDGFESDPERIYAVSLVSHDTLFSFKLPEQPGIRQNPRGLAWDGRYFWLLAEPVGSSSGRQLFKYDLGGSGTPSINLITKNLEFGNVQIDSTKIDYIFINNYGTANLSIDSIKISNTVFFINPVAYPVIIKPDSSLSIKISFKPILNQQYKDSIMFYHNDPNFQYSRTLLNGKGIYTNPFALLSENQIDYGSRRVKSSGFKTLTIENKGSKQLRIDSLSFASSNFKIVYPELLTYQNSSILRNDNPPLPLEQIILIDSVSAKSINIWAYNNEFKEYKDTLKIYCNASNGNLIKVPVRLNTVHFDSALGKPVWETTVPENPYISYNDITAHFMKKIRDINNDGVDDLIVTTDNYLTIAYNGNSSVWGDILWIFNTGINNNNSGKVERQESFQIIQDISGDSINDIIIGFGGGNECVYAINGVTGTQIWSFGDTVNYSNGDINGIDVKRDWNGDEYPDVLVSASGNEYTGEGRFSVYLLDGKTGGKIWQIDQSAQKKMKDGIISLENGGAVCSHPSGSSSGEVFGFDKMGNIIWTFPTSKVGWGITEIENIGGQASSDLIASDIGGNVYAIDGETGSQLWNTSIGNQFIENVFIIPDINNSGVDDIVIDAITTNIHVLEGSTGNAIWSNFTGGNILGVGILGDLNNDGNPEVGSASLNNQVHVFESKAGQILFNFAFGSGANGSAAECISPLGDADRNGSLEFASGSRDGRIIAFSGGTDVPTFIDDIDLTPEGFFLEQNYPNPFNPATTIKFRLPADSKVALSLFNILGEKVATLIDSEMKAGYHNYQLSTVSYRLSSGVYFYQLKAGEFIDIKKMILLK